MDSSLLQTINKQLLAFDRERGADGIVLYFLRALRETLAAYEGDRAPGAILRELVALHATLLACRPRMANLILDTHKAIAYLHSHPNATLEDLDATLQQLIDEKRVMRTRCAELIRTLVANEPLVLLHAHSATIEEALTGLAKAARPPQFLVVGQQPEKTQRLARALARLGLSYRVVSEYSVSHILDARPPAIFPALTLTAGGEAIMGPGSAGLISQLRSAGAAVYAVITSNKFSFWSEVESGLVFHEVRQKQLDGLVYEKEVFSHDAAPIEQLSALITERGLLTPAQARQVFEQTQTAFRREEAVVERLIHRGAPPAGRDASLPH